MKTVTYVPKACLGDDATFEGSIEIKTLGVEEKMTLYSDQGMDVDVGEDGLERVKKARSNITFLVSAIRVAKPKYVSVNLKHKATGLEFKSYDDLDSEAEGHPIISEVAMAMLSGFKVGNG